MTIDPIPTDAQALIDQALTATRSMAEEKGLMLEADVAEPLMVQTEGQRIEQVLINLIGNALKFTEKGGITVGVRRSGEAAEFRVEDSGCGIPADQLKHIFQHFTQVDGSSTRNAGDTGLGLAISERFVRLHGGRLWVESRVGEGSTFFFTVPLVEV